MNNRIFLVCLLSRVGMRHELRSRYQLRTLIAAIFFVTLNKERFISVYIFLGTPMSLIDMMHSMESQRLLDDGEYMVIHVDMMTYSQREAQKYLWS